MIERNYSILDRLISGVDGQLNSVFKQRLKPSRSYPAENIEELTLAESQRRQSEGFMRVNHAGEVSAQALYKAQALTARDSKVRETMQCSADEEIDHLFWCQKRLQELGGHTSYLGPFWFLGSFTLGTLAGLVGDKWNLGFVHETENQVVAHLDEHLLRIAENDLRSRAILQRMKEDEAHHASVALHSGASELPAPIKKAMRCCSRVMTKTAYWI